SADVVARIGGQAVPYSRFEEFLRKQVGEGAGALDSRVLSRLLDQFLDAELLTRLAVDEKRLAPAGGQRQALDSLVAEAHRIEERLASGEDFLALARELSLDPSAPAGGDQGEIAVEDLPPAFALQVERLSPGEVGEPIQASDGWHLFRLDERLPARHRVFAEVSGEITDRLRRQRGDALLAQRLAEAADKYNVVVYAQNLPFDYRGDHPRADQHPGR